MTSSCIFVQWRLENVLDVIISRAIFYIVRLQNRNHFTRHSVFLGHLNILMSPYNKDNSIINIRQSHEWYLSRPQGMPVSVIRNNMLHLRLFATLDAMHGWHCITVVVMQTNNFLLDIECVLRRALKWFRFERKYVVFVWHGQISNQDMRFVGTKTSANWMSAHKPTQLSRIKQKLQLDNPSFNHSGQPILQPFWTSHPSTILDNPSFNHSGQPILQPFWTTHPSTILDNPSFNHSGQPILQPFWTTHPSTILDNPSFNHSGQPILQTTWHQHQNWKWFRIERSYLPMMWSG